MKKLILALLFPNIVAASSFVSNEIHVLDIEFEAKNIDTSNLPIERREIYENIAKLAKIDCNRNGASKYRFYSLAVSSDFDKKITSLIQAEAVLKLRKNNNYMHGISKIKEFENLGNIEAVRYWENKISPIATLEHEKATKKVEAEVAKLATTSGSIKNIYYETIGSAKIYKTPEEALAACVKRAY